MRKALPILSASFFALIISFSSLGVSTAQAQSASPAHGKSTGTPEKKSDGSWESLKPAQQQILSPLEDDWDYMLPESRKKWIQVSNIYPKMNEQDQMRLQSRMMGWSNLSQKDRRVARENYLTSLKFPADKKAEAWSAYQKLSDEEKKKFAQVELNKKKPTAANAPTLQQHPVSKNPVLMAPAVSPPAQAPAPAAAEEPGSNTSANSSNPTPQ